MIESILIVSGIVLLAAVAYLEAINRLDERLPATELAKRVVGSRIPNLIVYEIIAVLIGSGLFIWHIKSPFYPQYILIIALGIVAMLVEIGVLNKYRFEPIELTKDEIVGIYFETIEDREAEEGIDYIIDYIQNPKWGVPETHLRIFLTRMAKRDDEYGRIARKRMAELGISNDESS